MYLLIGPAVAVVGIVAVLFVMRHRSVQTRSMYSSRRSRMQRKVQAARQRTLAPSGSGGQPPTAQEIAAGASAAPAAPAAPIYEAPAAPAPLQPQAWDVGPAPAPTPFPPAPALSPAPAPSAPATPAVPMPTPPEPAWTPAPAEQVWTPAQVPEVAAAPAPAPAPEPMTPAPAAPAASGSGGASWSIVDDARQEPADEATRDKGKRKGQAASGGGWELASGEAPGEEGAVEVKRSSAAMAVAQYAVLVVGLVMVLIGVLVMVANSKVT